MNNFRVFLALSLFLFSSYFIIDIVIYSFHWLLLLLSLIGFIGAYYVWPEKHDKESAWFDALEIVIELPFRTIALFFRGLGKIVKNADSGLDL